MWGSIRMDNLQRKDEAAADWNILKKHFTEHNGLLDQLERGRIISVKFGVEPETC